MFSSGSFYTCVDRKMNNLQIRGYDADGQKFYNKVKFRPVLYTESKNKDSKKILSEKVVEEVLLELRDGVTKQGIKLSGYYDMSFFKKILEKSPLALRMLKCSFNAELDGQAGIQELAGNATLLYYMSEEAQEGRDAYVEKRKPDFSQFPRLP